LFSAWARPNCGESAKKPGRPRSEAMRRYGMGNPLVVFRRPSASSACEIVAVRGVHGAHSGVRPRRPPRTADADPENGETGETMSRKSKWPLAICKRIDDPEFEATNSRPRRPTTASVTDTLEPREQDGSAGQRKCEGRSTGLEAFIERARSRPVRSTICKTRTPATRHRKNPSMNAKDDLGNDAEAETQTTNSGAMAIFGTLCEHTRSGYTKFHPSAK